MAGGTQMPEGWEVSIENSMSHLLSPYHVCKSFLQITLIFITQCLVSIIIPVFCGDRKRQFEEIRHQPDGAELVAIGTQARWMPTQGSFCWMPINQGRN